MDVINSGTAQMINLAETKSKNMERTMKKEFSNLLFQTVAAQGSNDPDSLIKIVGTQDNTVGAIDASTSVAQLGFDWNPYLLDLTGENISRDDLLDPSHAYSIDKILRKLIGSCTYDGNDSLTSILFTQGLWDVYEEFLITQKRYEGQAGKADGGFNYLLFRQIPIFVDNNVPGGKLNEVADGAAKIFGLNERYLGYRHSTKINFRWTPWKKKEDQPVYFSLLDWYGSFICSRRDRQGSVSGLPTDAELNA